MCCGGNTIERVRLSRCDHGVFHLYLGGQTLHLTARELLMIGQVISRWVHTHSDLLSELDSAMWRELNQNIEHD